MQVQNFECQIAKAQIGRYVAGDRLSEEAMEQLEAHVSKCPTCKQNLAERRAVLQAMLPTAEAVAPSKSEPRPSKFDLALFIKSKIQPKRPVQAVVQLPEAKPSTFTKPALYSLALGAVLIAMSYASRNMGSVLGPKAAAVPDKSAAENNRPEPPPSTDSNPTQTALGHDSVAAGDREATTFAKSLASATVQASELEPVPDSTVPPILNQPDPATTTAVKPAVRQPAHRHSHRQTPRPASNSIRIYDPEN